MTIEQVPPQSAHSFSRPDQENTQSSEQETGFAQLLEAMRARISDTPQTTTKVAAIRPRIGTDGVPFEEKALLVGTFAGELGARAVSLQETMLSQVNRLRGDVREAKHAMTRLGEEPVPVDLAVPVLAPMTSVASQSQSLIAPCPTASATTSKAPPTSAPASRSLAEPAPSIRTGKAAASPSPASRFSSVVSPTKLTSPANTNPIAVQLVAGEYGIKLVLKTPKLAEDERSELLCRIGEHLSEAGLGQIETIIYEAAKGTE